MQKTCVTVFVIVKFPSVNVVVVVTCGAVEVMVITFVAFDRHVVVELILP